MRNPWVVVLLVAGCGEVQERTVDAAVADARVDAVLVDAAAIDAQIDAPAPPVIPANPALWLRFEDNPADGVLDSAATPHTATCTVCPAQVTGIKGGAYEFTADRILVAASADLLPGTAFTISAWVRFASTPPGIVVIACKQQANNDCTYGLLGTSSNTVGYHSAGGTQSLGTRTLPNGTWHHVAMTWNGTTRIGYVDGAVDSTTAIATMGTEASVLSIGERNVAGSEIGVPGAIDEFLFYNRVLTQAEITLLATP